MTAQPRVANETAIGAERVWTCIDDQGGAVARLLRVDAETGVGSELCLLEAGENYNSLAFSRENVLHARAMDPIGRALNGPTDTLLKIDIVTGAAIDPIVLRSLASTKPESLPPRLEELANGESLVAARAARGDFSCFSRDRAGRPGGVVASSVLWPGTRGFL